MRRRYVAITASMMLFALPLRAEERGGQVRSADEIVRALLDSDDAPERGAKGLRPDANPSIDVAIQFDHDSAAITAASADQVRAIAQALQSTSLAADRFLIEGHTDNVGGEFHNLVLSEQRAGAVKARLVESFGIAASRLEAQGYGQRRPLQSVSQDTEAGRALNRRVVLVNLGPRPGVAEGAAATDWAVDVSVKYQRGGTISVLKPGDALTPDDDYRVTFVPSHNGYVYVCQVDSSGKIDVIFPNPTFSHASNPVSAGRTYLVPPEGSWLSLDEHRGREEIIVLAAPQPLADPKVAARDLHAAAGRAAEPVAADHRHANGSLDGVFAFRLPFDHQ